MEVKAPWPETESWAPRPKKTMRNPARSYNNCPADIVLEMKPMSNITLDLLYKELKSLNEHVELLTNAVIPVEKISEEERQELKEIANEMDSGQKFSSKDVFGV